jgi:hypothetical protein
MKLLMIVLIALLLALGSSLRLGESSRQKILTAVDSSHTNFVANHEAITEKYRPSVSSIQNDAPDTANSLPLWAKYLVCAIGILIGLIEIFVGYRIFHISVFFVCGFIGALLMTLILEGSLADDTVNREWIILGVALATWVLFGMLCVFLISFTIFLMGASIGVIIALILNAPLLQYAWPEQPEAMLIIFCIIFGVITGTIVLCLERPLIIMATAIFGAFLLIYSIGGIAGNMPVINDNETQWQSVPWEWWAYFGGWLAAVGVGALVQFCVTAVGVDHSSKAPAGYTKL